jgi:hypothetical protein
MYGRACAHSRSHHRASCKHSLSHHLHSDRRTSARSQTRHRIICQHTTLQHLLFESIAELLTHGVAPRSRGTLVLLRNHSLTSQAQNIYPSTLDTLLRADCFEELGAVLRIDRQLVSETRRRGKGYRSTFQNSFASLPGSP